MIDNPSSKIGEWYSLQTNSTINKEDHLEKWSCEEGQGEASGSMDEMVLLERGTCR